jgi:hypothetical protein
MHHMTVLDGIEMNVMGVLRNISIVSQGVLPKPVLPQMLNPDAPAQTVRDRLLDQHPSG